MALYSIEWKQSARKEVKKLGKEIIPRILKVIESLADDPHPKGSKKIQGSMYTYRVRVGEYRIVYNIKQSILVIEVIKLGHRKDIYRNLT